MIDLKDGIKLQVIVGKFMTYSELLADDGYCFYDKDEPENERQYHTSIKTPENDVLVLKDKYISVLGNADVLNQEISERIEKEMLKDLEVQDGGNI